MVYKSKFDQIKLNCNSQDTVKINEAYDLANYEMTNVIKDNHNNNRHLGSMYVTCLREIFLRIKVNIFDNTTGADILLCVKC